MSKLEQTVETLEQLALLGEIHSENPFKIRAFINAARTLQKLGEDFDKLYDDHGIKKVKGIGKGVYEIIDLIMNNKPVTPLEELLESTPPGLLEILKLPGIGPKKVRVLWKKLDITTLGELEYACQENRLTSLEGFGAKTQENLKKAISRQKQLSGFFRLDQGYLAALAIIKLLEEIKDLQQITIGGDIAAGFEIADLIEINIEAVKISAATFKHISKIFSNLKNDKTAKFLTGTYNNFPVRLNLNAKLTSKKTTQQLITRKDLQGAFHNHTLASDGINTLEEMRDAAIAHKLNYLSISDHSQSAFYANGLKPDELLAQCQKIAKLNQDSKAKKCHLFSGIESDILKEGQLDYANETLEYLDLVIGSVHSRLKQDATQMTKRMVNAALNPWTTIIGHPTGRLLLGREPSQYDMEEFLKACKENDTAVELNANPHRLDLNAKHLRLAKEMGVKIAINADAHSTEGLADLEYGIMLARNAGLTPKDVLNCLPLKDVLQWLNKRKERAIKLSNKSPN